MTASFSFRARLPYIRPKLSRVVRSFAVVTVGMTMGWGGVAGLGGADAVVAEEIRLEYRAAGDTPPAADSPDETTATRSEVLSNAKERFLVVGLSAAGLREIAEQSWDQSQWQRVWRIQLGSVESSLPSLLGQYEVSPDGLFFVPRFPLRSGQTYRTTLELHRLPSFAPGDESQLVKVFTVEGGEPARSEPTEPPELVAIYPTGSILPENQLKFYLHFSTSMRRGVAYQQLRLWAAEPSSDTNHGDAAKRDPAKRDTAKRDTAKSAQEGSWRRIEYPFLELPEELWDPEYKRFTLFFDPGRIKRGLRPREEFGPALEEGRRYRLEVDRQWQSASGQPLVETVRKEFLVVAPDDQQPDYQAWRVTDPASSNDWLRLDFDEALDHGMLQRVITVHGPNGDRLGGEVVIDQEETRWSFRPRDAWQSGPHSLAIGTHLEDRAGNSLAKPFEVDLFDSVAARVETATVQIPFRVDVSAEP